MISSGYKDMYGNPVMESSLEEITEDLQQLAINEVIAICAAYIVVHDSQTWTEIYKRIKDDDKE